MLLFSAIDTPDDCSYMENLYREFHRLMYATAQKYVSNPTEQQDIVQDSLVKLIKKTRILRPFPRYILSSYIVATVRNTAINYLKRQSSGIALTSSIDDEAFEEPIAPLPSMEDLVLLAEQKDTLIALWGKLPEEDRTLLEGKYILGLSDEELAAQLHCKTGSVRMKLTRARRRALEWLTEKDMV